MVLPTMLRDYVQDKLNFSKVASEIFRALTTDFDIVLVQPCCSDRVLPVENAVTLHFYDPFIKMSLSHTSFTDCNQPPRSVLLPECCRRCCCLCRNCYLVVKLVVFVNRGFVHAMRIVLSFSAMPQCQFFLYCSFRLYKDCCSKHIIMVCTY